MRRVWSVSVPVFRGNPDPPYVEREHMRRQILASGAAITVALALLIAVPALSQGVPNPPGNNGTIKIDDLLVPDEPDDDPNNEPHVDCLFQVDFYGYDQGNLNATVTFEAWPPTEREGDDQVLLEDTVFIGEDDNSGGGSEAGLDASETYLLDFTGIEPHEQQGFHVRVTIHAQGSQGADVKHKVFWVQECPPKPTPTPTPTKTPSETPTTPPTTETPSMAPTTPGETPVPVPTAVPAGATGSGSGSPGLASLVLAGGAAAAGAAVVARRRFLNDS